MVYTRPHLQFYLNSTIYFFFILTSSPITIICSLLEFLVISQWPHSLVFLSIHLIQLLCSIVTWTLLSLVPMAFHSGSPLTSCLFLSSLYWHLSLVWSSLAAGSQVLYSVFFLPYITSFPWVSTWVVLCQLPPTVYISWWSPFIISSWDFPIKLPIQFFKLSISKTKLFFSEKKTCFLLYILFFVKA